MIKSIINSLTNDSTYNQYFDPNKKLSYVMISTGGYKQYEKGRIVFVILQDKIPSIIVKFYKAPNGLIQDQFKKQEIIYKKRFSFKKNGNFIAIKSIAVQHGNIKSQSFIINKSCAYISDANKIYNKDLKYFKNLNYLVIDCLRFNKHPSHFNLNEVIDLTKLLKPKKTVLTNLHSDLDYKYMLNVLPKNIIPGYDGMSFYI